MVLDGKSSQEYPVKAGVPQGSILASKLDSDLQDTVDWGRNWLVDFSAQKT